jgi:glycosyltransferase 2 family protein
MRSSLVRIGFSLLLLGVLLQVGDAGEIVARIGSLRGDWVLVAMAISVPQVALSAFRWRLTAARLGIDLPFRAAFREYYLATFLNQVLPGGVAGDVSRAWRHSRASDRPALGAAARAVILERASGQIVVGAVAVGSLAVLPLTYGPTVGLAGVGAAGALAALIVGLRIRRRNADSGTSGSSIWGDIYTALLARDVLVPQLAISSLIVGSYLSIYLVAARAVGADLPAATLLPLVAPVLMSMLIPAGIAGWGVREAAAVALWGAVGLTVADGLAISITYGVLMLVSSVPGAVVLLGERWGRRRVEEEVKGAPSKPRSLTPAP